MASSRSRSTLWTCLSARCRFLKGSLPEAGLTGSASTGSSKSRWRGQPALRNRSSERQTASSGGSKLIHLSLCSAGRHIRPGPFRLSHLNLASPWVARQAAESFLTGQPLDLSVGLAHQKSCDLDQFSSTCDCAQQSPRCRFRWYPSKLWSWRRFHSGLRSGPTSSKTAAENQSEDRRSLFYSNWLAPSSSDFSIFVPITRVISESGHSPPHWIYPRSW